MRDAAMGRREALSTRVGFFVAGFGMAAWAPLVVFAEDRTGLDDGGLGLLLLGLGGGSITAMPTAGLLAARFGCRAVIVAAAALLCLTLPALATVASTPFLALTLVCFGAGVGTVDCVINMQAVIVERAIGRPMMSGFHGLFSVGGIVGAGGVSALLRLGASPFAATLVVAACIVVALAFAGRDLLPHGGAASGSAFALPRGIVLFIGILCFIVFLTKGSMLDWSAVFLTTQHDVDPAGAGLGYTAFASAMTVGRLSGDVVVRRIGHHAVITFGGLLAAAGLATAVLAPGWVASVIGFTLVGAGCANVVPVLYSAVGQQDTMPEHVAVPAISTLGYAGILAGPALIGTLAHLTNLGVAFLSVAVLLLGVSASSRYVR